ncbi:hypothetical protein XELAEV_18023629mg [Xenopus laevis]|uniref:Uncharacterized protein n=1 Tax=Xenopus laevis TaxID=8355 RepID=A0A974D5G5_XENLA|nr:hypothetical protein XELAEV_18023629mg [Xenopus laevis]
MESMGDSHSVIQSFLDIGFPDKGSYTCINFTGEWSDTSLNFLDIKLSVCGNKIITEMYSKPTDRNTLLLHSSYHNPHTLNTIPKGQYMRERRTASSDIHYKKAADILTRNCLSDTNNGSLFRQTPMFSYTSGRILRDILCPSDIAQQNEKTIFWGPPEERHTCLNCVAAPQ